MLPTGNNAARYNLNIEESIWNYNKNEFNEQTESFEKAVKWTELMTQTHVGSTVIFITCYEKPTRGPLGIRNPDVSSPMEKVGVLATRHRLFFPTAGNKPREVHQHYVGTGKQRLVSSPLPSTGSVCEQFPRQYFNLQLCRHARSLVCSI